MQRRLANHLERHSEHSTLNITGDLRCARTRHGRSGRASHVVLGSGGAVRTSDSRALTYLLLSIGFLAFAVLRLAEQPPAQDRHVPEDAGGYDDAIDEDGGGQQGMDASGLISDARSDTGELRLPPGFRVQKKVLRAEEATRRNPTLDDAYWLDGVDLDLSILLVTKDSVVTTTANVALVPIQRHTPGIAPRRITIVNFWADFCIPCRVEMPLLRDFMNANFGSDKVVGYSAIHVMEDKSGIMSAANYAQLLILDSGAKLPDGAAFYFEKGDGESPLLNRLEANKVAHANLPLTMIIDCQGRIRWVHNGGIDEAFLRDSLKPAIDALLTETSAPGVCPVAGDNVCTSPPERCAAEFPECNQLCKHNGTCDEFAGEKCALGVTDCYSKCKYNETCDDFAGETYQKAEFIEVCRNKIEPASCRAEYHPTTHRWCSNDGKCDTVAEQQEAVAAIGAKKTGKCPKDCKDTCLVERRDYLKAKCPRDRYHSGRHSWCDGDRFIDPANATQRKRCSAISR